MARRQPARDKKRFRRSKRYEDLARAAFQDRGYAVICPTSKVWFPDKAAAGRRLDELATEGRRGKPVPTRCYYCGDCGGWHLTTREDRMPPRS